MSLESEVHILKYLQCFHHLLLAILIVFIDWTQNCHTTEGIQPVFLSIFYSKKWQNELICAEKEGLSWTFDIAWCNLATFGNGWLAGSYLFDQQRKGE